MMFIYRILITLTLAVLCLVSCTSREDGVLLTTTSSTSLFSFENPYEFIGRLHNEALDTVKVQGISKNQLKGFTNDFTLRHFAQMPEFSNSLQDEKAQGGLSVADGCRCLTKELDMIAC